MQMYNGYLSVVSASCSHSPADGRSISSCETAYNMKHVILHLKCNYYMWRITTILASMKIKQRSKFNNGTIYELRVQIQTCCT
jgi:hypothetical protein